MMGWPTRLKEFCTFLDLAASLEAHPDPRDLQDPLAQRGLQDLLVQRDHRGPKDPKD